MLKACKLTSPLSTAFGDAWKLYKASFPREERRPLRLHAQAMQQEPSFHCYTFYSDDTFVGLLFYWEFSTCIYIEHLAVNIMNRGQGNGAKILDFVHQQGKAVILEIEPLTDAATESRLHFYEKTGYSEEYISAHNDDFSIGYISMAGTMRTADGKLLQVMYIYCRENEKGDINYFE